MSLVLLAEVSPASAASSGRYIFDIPSAPAATALASFASVTGIAIGWPAGLPPLQLRPLRGRMTADAALRRLLAGSGYRARRVGEAAYSIVRASTAPVIIRFPSLRARIPETPVLTTVPSGEIVVTGQKQPQALQDVPMSVAVVDLAGAQTGRISSGTRDIADSVEGLAITNLGPGRNRQFIRGVADSPFNGPSQSTVAVQLDEARITFDAPDPDIRVVDLERVEILKGPQGPLYGSGALGGIYHIVTRKPDLASPGGGVRIGGEAVEHGGPGGGIDAILNLPLVNDRLAVRAVGYIAREGGWIDNEGRNRNGNATKVAGARLSARWQPDPEWTIDISGILQDVNTRDSQYVSASDDTIRRLATIPEPTDNDFKSSAVTVRGKLGGLDVLGTTSYVRQQVESILDSSPASAAFGLAGASRFTDDRDYEIFNHELRLSSSSRLRWLAGFSYLDARSHASGTISSEARSLSVESLDRLVRETAVFGEVTVPILSRVDATVGARLFRSSAEDETIERAGGSVDRIANTILSPSLSLSWKPQASAIIYLRYARAVRPGGLALAGETQSRRFQSDELGTLDLGMRYGDPNDRLSFSASAYYTDWRHIQSDYLLPDGLVSTRNAGRGRVLGAEASGDWRATDRLRLSLGLSYVDAMLTRTTTGEELDDRRLPVTPEATVRAVAEYRFKLGDWSARAAAQVNYVGSARLSFDPDLDRTMGDYATAGVSSLFVRSSLTIGVRVDNVLDARGDSFAFGNPFSIAAGRQYTPLRPRTLSVSIGRTW